MQQLVENPPRDWRSRISGWGLGELVLWCVPALVVAVTLRIILTVQLPYALWHDDAQDFFNTAEHLVADGELRIHEKKTFLSPLIFTAPFVLGIPGMIVIPAVQHVLGVIAVLMAGALCRLWFARWKVFVIPVTVSVAVNPAMLWFEHAIVAENHFVFCTLLLALAGSVYAKAPTRGRFVFLCIACFGTAGARPEGKLLLAFGAALLVAKHWGALKAHWHRLAWFAVVAATTLFLTRTSQSGLLLYTSVARMTPTSLRCAPGFEPYIAELRADLQQRWNERREFPQVRDRKAIAKAVRTYLDDQAKAGKRDGRGSDEALCRQIAIETCLANLPSLPAHTFEKFRAVATVSPAPLLDRDFFDKQLLQYSRQDERLQLLGPGLFGRNYGGDAEWEEFVGSGIYGEVAWFNSFSERWYETLKSVRLPDTVYPNPSAPAVPAIRYGLPIYMLLGCAGLVVVAMVRGRLRRFHVTWGITLVLFVFGVILTANVRARFRFFLEPFWPLYIAALLDVLMLWTITKIERRSAETPEEVPPRQ